MRAPSTPSLAVTPSGSSLPEHHDCRTHDDADDAVQDALLIATENLDTFRGDGSLEGWLIRLVASACARRRRGREEQYRAWHDSELALTGEGESPEDTADRHGVGAILERVLLELAPDDYRHLVLLAEVEDMTEAEVAERLGISPGAVRTRLSRCAHAPARGARPRAGTIAARLVTLRRDDGSTRSAPNRGAPGAPMSDASHTHALEQVNELNFDAAVVAIRAARLHQRLDRMVSPCKVAAPLVAALARRHAGKLKVVEIDGDASPELTARLGVRGFPTFLGFFRRKTRGLQARLRRRKAARSARGSAAQRCARRTVRCRGERGRLVTPP